MEVEKTIIGNSGNLSGTKIGGYKLLQKIGEGGFGDVYMAEQTEPVRRMVALKLIKPGMDSREVIARFESERQALALMEHPNIAQVFDAGTTPTGQPFFVMELVRGVPITEFCDKNRLPSEDRLKLFLSVCHAVQHAHHKGIIHRDIKPSNVMVTLHDGVPVVKVIDFGVAKATAQKLTERTLFTAYGQMIGTPAYMSPEQAEMSGLDIDTRSDIYSLGVLLYELLTGSTPLDINRLRAAGFVQLQKMISEEEAQRPSLRISSLGEQATILAGNRGTDVKRLTASLQGDLDWIVMKALEKDRNRRYGTPNSLASDLERFLKGDVIEARPPSLSYRMQRLLSRHRTFVITSVCIAVGLLSATVVSVSMAVRATRAERVAEQKRFEVEETQKALEQSLAETLFAKKEAEKLTAEVAVGNVTLNFNDTTLLKLANHLTKISKENSDYQDFIKLNILGALNYIAAQGKSGESDGWSGSNQTWEQALLRPASLNIHSIDGGILALSRLPSQRDLTAIDLRSGLPLWNVPDVSGDGSPVNYVYATEDTLCVLDSQSRLHGLARRDGRRKYVTQLPAEAAKVWKKIEWWSQATAEDAIVFTDKRKTQFVVARKTIRDSNEPSAAVIVNSSTGKMLNISIEAPKDAVLLSALSDDGLQFATSFAGGQLSLWDTRDGRSIFQGKVSEQDITALAFRPDGKVLAFCITDPGEEKTATLSLWDCESHKVISSWKTGNPASGFLDFITDNVLTDQSGTWVLDENGAGESSSQLREATANKVRVLPQAVAYANEDWLVNGAGNVYSSKTFRPVAAPPGRRYPEPLKEFAAGERYLRLGSKIVDLKLDTLFPGEYWDTFEEDRASGFVYCGVSLYCSMVVPTNLQNVSADVLKTLVELVACGELDAHGVFVPWTEDSWNSRQTELIRTGFLDLPISLSLREFLMQPAFWARNRVAQIAAENGPAPSNEHQEAWDYLLSIDDSVFTQLAILNVKILRENLSDLDRLTLEMPLARKYRDEFWEVRFGNDTSKPGSALALDDNLTPQQLAMLNEWFTSRSLYRQKKDQQTSDKQVTLTVNNETGVPEIKVNPAIPPEDVFIEAYALFREDRIAEALNHLDDTVKSIPLSKPTEGEAAAEIPTEVAVRLLVLQATLFAEQQRFPECLAAIARLRGQLELPDDRILELHPKMIEVADACAIPHRLLARWQSVCPPELLRRETAGE